MTKYDWEKVFRMSVMEFFSFLAFYNYQQKKREQEIKKMNRRK